MLYAHELSIARGGISLLTNLSFEVAAGEALALRGPNGSGKTTFLRTLVGLQPPLAGRVDCPDDSCAYAAHLDGLKATLTVAENLAFWAAVFGNADIQSALDAFDLTQLRHRPAGRLSAGQKRRLGLARLLVSGRPIWCLDEPTVSLDKTAIALFDAAIAAHLAEGGLAVIATHVDLGVPTKTLDLTPYRAEAQVVQGTSDEAFL